MQYGKHLLIIIVTLVLILGLPMAVYRNSIQAVLNGSTADAVSGATMELPDQPSGRFVILLNPEKHPETADQWSDFFSGIPGQVIMDDIHCLVLDADATGIQLAERLQARLAEHQMTVHAENAAMLTSRTEQGFFDVVILSAEADEACQIQLRPSSTVRVSVDGDQT